MNRAAVVKAADELKELGERKLSDLISPYSTMCLEDVLAQCALQVDSAAAIKTRGAIFTPAWLARRVSRRAAQWWKRLDPGRPGPRTIADLSCGSGVFLEAASEAFGADVTITGQDVHAESLIYADLARAARDRPWTLAQADSLKGFAKQSTLFDSAVSGANGRFDVLIGNPPYVRSANLEPTYADFLRRRFESTASGNFDLSTAFIENAIERLNEGGLFSYIVSSKFSQSSYGRVLCEKLARETRVLEIEYFGDQQLFHGYTTYVMVLTVAKLPPAKKFRLTTFPPISSAPEHIGEGNSTIVATQVLNSVPWGFASGAKQDVLSLFLAKEHTLLFDVFNGLFQGVRTGANDVFVVNGRRRDSLESELLLPFVNGRQIDRFAIDGEAASLIFPYVLDDFGVARLVDEEQLSSRYPAVWKHLRAYKSALEERSQGQATAWYGYSRSQNLAGHKVRKVLVKEMMARVEFAADAKGEIAFGSGYALDASRLTSSDLLLWTAVLNTPTMEFQLRHAGTQLHSGWFRLLKHHLKRVRLPRFKTSRKVEAIRIAKSAAQAQTAEQQDDYIERLDVLVADAFKLTRADRVLVKGFISDCHSRSLKQDILTTNKELEQVALDSGDAYEPVKLERFNPLHRDRPDLQHAVTFKASKKLPIHRWYPYTQGFSPALVETLMDELSVRPKQVVLDPFAGSGTTNVVCKARGIDSIGVDVSPLMTWVSSVKAHSYSVTKLRTAVDDFDYGKAARKKNVNPPNLFAEYFSQAYAPHILGQVLSLSSSIGVYQVPTAVRHFMMLGLIGLLEEISNIRKHGSHYRFLNKTDSIGVQKLNIPILASTADVGDLLRQRHQEMLTDVAAWGKAPRTAVVNIITGDARNLTLPDKSVDAVITSPPYLNRNNYIAQQKAELSVLGLVETYENYKRLVQSTFRSHVESALGDDSTSPFPEINLILEKISLTPGNNPKIPHMISGYFSDLADTLGQLFRVLAPGGKAAFVVGNTRWGGVVIPIDHLLLMLAERVGFRADKILVTRMKGNSPQQMRMYGRIAVRESVVIFSKPSRGR